LAGGLDSFLCEHLEGAEESPILGELFQLVVELPILVAPANPECFVGSARGPAVEGEILSRVVGAPNQFRAKVAVAAPEQLRPWPGGAIVTLELALPSHQGPEPPEYDVHGHMITSADRSGTP
jgi:hypothetical protein